MLKYRILPPTSAAGRVDRAGARAHLDLLPPGLPRYRPRRSGRLRAAARRRPGERLRVAEVDHRVDAHARLALEALHGADGVDREDLARRGDALREVADRLELHRLHPHERQHRPEHSLALHGAHEVLGRSEERRAHRDAAGHHHAHDEHLHLQRLDAELRRGGSGADDPEERERVGGIDVDLALPPHGHEPLLRVSGLGVDEGGPEVVGDATHHPHLLERVVRRVLAAIRLGEELVPRVFHGVRRRAARQVAREELLVGVGPVDERAAGGEPVVEVTGGIALLEERVVLDGRHRAHQLLGEPDVRDLVRGAHVDVDLRVLVDDRDLEVAALEAQVLAERQVETRELREVPRAVLVVEGAEDAVGVLPDRELRRVLLHEHEERRDARAHRRLGGDEQTRQVHGAPGEVLGLHAVARGGGGGELGTGVVLELGQHDDHDRDGAQHHDERDARFLLAALRAPRARGDMWLRVGALIAGGSRSSGVAGWGGRPWSCTGRAPRRCRHP